MSVQGLEVAQFVNKETVWWVCVLLFNLFYLAILVLFWCQKLVMQPHQKLKINPTKYYKAVITLGGKIL